MIHDVKKVMRLLQAIILPVAIFVLYTGCGSDQNSDEANAGFGYENVKISSVYKGCTAGDDDCTYYTVDFPMLKGFDGADSINQAIMTGFLEVKTKDEIRYNADEFIELYEKTYRDAPDERLPWYYFSQTDVQLLYDSVVQVHMNVNEYTGGAHANFGEYYRNYNLKGEQIDYKAFTGEITNGELEKELTSVFASQFEEGKSLLLDGTVQPTQNYFPVDHGVVFVYNPYDIAPFSAGVIKLRITRR